MDINTLSYHIEKAKKSNQIFILTSKKGEFYDKPREISTYNDSDTSHSLGKPKKTSGSWKSKINSASSNRRTKMDMQRQLEMFEVWKPYPKDPSVLISTFGRGFKKGKIYDSPLTPSDCLGPYFTINLNGHSVPMHTAVAETFIGPHPGPKFVVVNHFDTNRQNNRLDNLEYITQSGNIVHAHLFRNLQTIFKGKETLASWNKTLASWCVQDAIEKYESEKQKAIRYVKKYSNKENK